MELDISTYSKALEESLENQKLIHVLVMLNAKESLVNRPTNFTYK